MRVVAGELGGRRLRTADVPGLRPTSDRVREAVFSILGDAVAEARVLDLYAGTGAMAIEALSRGAERAVCVEIDHRVRRELERNVADLGLRDRVEIVADDALDVCRGIAEDGPTYDMVFLDPPYAVDPGPLVASVVRGGWWTRVCAFEHAARTELPTTPGDPPADTRRWGDTAVTFFWRA